MKQKQYSPLSVAEQAVSLFAVNEGYIDDVEIKKVVDFEAALLSYMRSSHADLLKQINDNPVYDDAVESGLRKAVEDFKATHTW